MTRGEFQVMVGYSSTDIRLAEGVWVLLKTEPERGSSKLAAFGCEGDFAGKTEECALDSARHSFIIAAVEGKE